MGGLSAIMSHSASIFIISQYSRNTSFISTASDIYWLVLKLLLCLYGAWVWHQNGHHFFHQPTKKRYHVSSLLQEPYSTQKYIILGSVLSVLLLISVLMKQGIFHHLYTIIYVFTFILLADKKIEAWIFLIIGAILLQLSTIYQMHTLSTVAQSGIWSKLLILIYGFIYWKSKRNKKETLQLIPLSSLLKTVFLSCIYIIATVAVPLLLTVWACRNSTGCSGIPAGIFIGFIYLVSFVVAAILLLKKKEHFKQWQLFFLVNGLFGVSVLQLIYTLFRIIN
ncbi:MAG: hypothetical protein IKN18_05520 [Neisseriaceae bacterium]|nr:hypothetical protein [Neisseriaceae bacterium]